MKDLGWHGRELERGKIYYCREVVESKSRAAVIVRRLLDAYVPGVLNYKRASDKGSDTTNNLVYESLSPNFRYVCERQLEGVDGHDYGARAYLKLRLVVDQIAGMTDSRALSDYRVLTAGK